MDCIKNMVADRLDKIKEGENVMASLAFQMFEIIDKFFEEIHDMNWASYTGKLTVLGGIMINCDE